MFERKYEIVPNAPAHMSWDDYSKISLKEYRNLLETASDDETAFQHFFDLRKVTRLNNNLISNVLLNSLDSTKTHFSADSAHVLLRLEGNKARTQRKSLSKKWETR